MKTKKGNSHTTIRNGKFFCLNCGGDQKIPYPVSIPMFAVIAKQFDAEHANCLPNWKQPEVDLSLPVIARAKWWLENGERGMSSETIFRHLCSEPLLPDIPNYAHPKDPDDFRRCYMLLKAIPEWRDEIWKLSILSPVWKKIVDKWDRLCWMLEEQLGGKENDMWKFMEGLGC
jgi:hypothetical protein